MSRILVTGSNGYIGRHLVPILIEMGHSVTCVDVQEKAVSLNAVYYKKDIFSDATDLFEELGSPEILFHLAWKDGFVHNSESHLDYLPRHYRFIRNMVMSGVRNVSVMGSMHEVGYYEGALDETVPNNPRSLYGISKNALRSALELFEKTQPFSFHWLRGFYICGDDMHNNSIFTKILQTVASGKKDFPFTTGLNQYDFIDIDDLATEIALAGTQDEVTGIINCCSGKPISLKEKIESFLQDNHLDVQLNYGEFPERPYDSKLLYGNNEKIKKIVQNAIDKETIISKRLDRLKKLLEI